MEVVTFGETMVQLVPDRMAPLEYVDGFHKHVAGAESNVAIGLARMGHSAGWFSKLGNDPFGRYVRQFITGHGVDTSEVRTADEAPTGVFFKELISPDRIQVYYYRRQSAASLMNERELNEAYVAKARILHVTGITPALSPECRKLTFRAMEAAKKHGTAIVFDPNIRWKLWNREEARGVLGAMAGLADYVLPGVEEGRFLTGGDAPEEIAERLLEAGAGAVVIKLGGDGAYYRSGESAGYEPGFPVRRLVDPMGAGDGFAAGFISGLLLGEKLPAAVRRGNAVGSIVVGVSGDVEGLPARYDVERLLAGGTDSEDITR
ncbi:sugar kinase [Paenibacillus sp. HN-1]|uniref:sugar kinase n=1 Tax=Paenibacillus TaxID=44249 RepID=UPI001CA8CE8C|nr:MULTISPECIES: sugar kinase [Paenibacillus]MBY9079102.1 sugar kinase [Paenibacillus sp. CGMCC 1.18879]MBY9086880.1 sugar kinase [Paenibacillus sinensis]